MKRPDLIFTLNRTEVCCIATEIGWLYGIRTDKDQRHGCGKCKISFVDIDFKHPDKEYHNELVMQYKPKYATVLDITDMTMVSNAILTASWFAGHGIEPIVIPKIDCIADVPKSFILGYSVPTRYGSTTLQPECFRGRRIHLLGGTPKQAASYYRCFLELGCEVTSIDSNSSNKAAVMGSVWRDRHRYEWQNIYPKGGHYIECLSESLRNIYDFWQEMFDDPYLGQGLLNYELPASD